MFKYVISNVIFYRRKYFVILILFLIIACFVSLSLMLYFGLGNQAGKYARSMGDIDFGILVQDPDILKNDERINLIQSRFNNKAMKYIKEELKSNTYIEFNSVTGKLYNKQLSISVVGTSVNIMQRFNNLKGLRGDLPGNEEICIPYSLSDKLKIGDVLTFGFLSDDKIFSTIKFKISGTYFPSSDFKNYILFSNMILRELVGEKHSSYFCVYLPEELRTTKDGLLDIKDFFKIQDNFNDYFAEFNDDVFISFPSNMLYLENQNYLLFYSYISLIVLIILVFITTMVIINVLYITVTERVNILGMFLALGLKKNKIAIVLAFEVAIFTLVSSLLGVFLSIVLSNVLKNFEIVSDVNIVLSLLGGGQHLVFMKNFVTIFLPVLFSCCLSFLVSFLVVHRIIGKPVIDLLNYN